LKRFHLFNLISVQQLHDMQQMQEGVRMAGLRDIKLRIKSVTSTQQITKAMNLISTVKLKKARDRMESAIPYKEALDGIFHDIISGYTAEFGGALQSIYTRKRNSNKVLYIVISSDKGLCGSYNTSIIKKAVSIMDGMDSQIITIGVKASSFFSKRGYKIVSTFDNFMEKADIQDIDEITKILLDKYNTGEVEEVVLLYTEFISSMEFNTTYERLLPIEIVQKSHNDYRYGFEPSPDVVLNNIMPRYISGWLSFAFANSFASEQSSRMVAMSAATENASKMIDDLTLHYNRARQASITNEISEIVGGTEALK